MTASAAPAALLGAPLAAPAPAATGAAPAPAAPALALPALPGTPTLIGIGGFLLLAVVLTHLAVRRGGGWRVARRRLRREAAATAAAFAEPVRALLRHRRQVRTLGRLLACRAGWADAERAAVGAAAVAGARPYAVLLGAELAGVLVAAGPGTPPRPPEPWVVDERDARLWWIRREDAAARAAGGGPSPLLVVVGTVGREAVLMDLSGGPAVTEFGGDRVHSRAVLQAVAAQLDARLPAGAVLVADGVHTRHPGPEPDAALAAAQRAAAGGEPAFAVCATAPGGRPTGSARVLTLAGTRGSARLLTVRQDGLRLRGTALRVGVTGLARATARILRELPPYPAVDAVAEDDGDLVEPLLAGRAADPDEGDAETATGPAREPAVGAPAAPPTAPAPGSDSAAARPDPNPAEPDRTGEAAAGPPPLPLPFRVGRVAPDPDALPRLAEWAKAAQLRAATADQEPDTPSGASAATAAGPPVPGARGRIGRVRPVAGPDEDAFGPVRLPAEPAPQPGPDASAGATAADTGGPEPEPEPEDDLAEPEQVTRTAGVSAATLAD